MDYTIMSLHGPGDEYVLSLLRHGGADFKYKIVLIRNDNFECWDRCYRTMEDALRAFNRGTEVIARNLGKFEYKCKKIADID